jgi:GH35 family endo-1,4-beta-xylanase
MPKNLYSYFRKIFLIGFSLLISSAALHANLDLLNAENNAVVSALSLSQNSINLNSIEKRAFNIKYTASNSSTASVEFFINNKKFSTVSGSGTFLMYQNGEAWLPNPGSYTLSAKAYSAASALLESDSEVLVISDALSHRMRKVFISTGVPFKNVSLRMKKHQYIFGSQTVESGSYNATDTKPYPVRVSGFGANSQQMEYITEYQNTFLENFNYSVAGNAMKWYSMGTNGVNFTNADRWYDWHTARGIPVRGHTLLWGKKSSTNINTENMHDPQWIEDLMEGTEAEKEQAKAAINNRIQQVVSHYAGQIDEWDFNNELWNYDHYRRQFDGQPLNNGTSAKASHNPSGPSILSEFAATAKAANPNIKLYHNDYNIITQGNSSNATSYRDLLIDLRDNHGVPVDGIGVQGHFGSTNRTKASIKSCFDVLDDLGVPIKITELDIGAENSSEVAKANQLENVFRAAFEHQAVEGIIFWGFWSGCHWRDHRAPWQYQGYSTASTSDDDPATWIETDQVTRYRGLVFDEWWSDADLIADADGNIEIAVFAGDFDINIDGVDIPKTLPTNDNGDTLYLLHNNNELLEINGEFTLIRPEEGSTYYSNEPIAFEASYPDGSTTAINNVEFFINGQLHKRDSVPPFEATWYDAPEGSHTVSVIPNDDASASLSASLTVGGASNLGPNLISNPSFEAPALDTAIQTFGGDVTLSNSSAYASVGSQSLFVERSNPSQSWQSVRYVFPNTYQNGQAYQFSTLIYLPLNSSNCNVLIKKPVTNEYVTVQSATGLASGQWHELSGEFTFDSDMGFLYIAGIDAGENFFIDNIQIRELGGNINPEDTDMDGMPDSWEMTYFGNLGASATGDNDSDGVSNLVEYRTGTDPSIGYLSYFHIYYKSFAGGNTSIGWIGSTEKLYRVLSTTDLSTGNWEVLGEALPNTTGLEYYNESNSGTLNKFYKIEIDE